MKDKIQDEIQKKVEQEMESQTKLRTVREDKQEREEYITTCNNDILKIRLHMSELKKNYLREKENMKFPTCK